MKALERRNQVEGMKKAALGWTLGGGALLFLPTLTVLVVTIFLVACAILFGFAKWFTFGSVCGVGMMLIFKPLVMTALIVGLVVLAIIGATSVFLGSKTASPPSNR